MLKEPTRHGRGRQAERPSSFLPPLANGLWQLHSYQRFRQVNPPTVVCSQDPQEAYHCKKIVRLVAWYLLYTVLFRCPEAPTNDSPTICHTANTVSTTLRPHLEPYYNQYVEPYVSEYAPYVKKANEEYLVPAYDKVTHSYKQYAAPHVSRSKDYVTKGYNRAVKPRVDEVSLKAKVYYDEYLSSHVAKGEKIYTTAQPHLSKAQKTIEEAFRDILIPAYAKVLPYVIRVYEQIWHVVVTIVAPMVKQNGEKAVYWGVGIWSDVVRPQVGRIGERLGGTGNG